MGFFDRFKNSSRNAPATNSDFYREILAADSESGALTLTMLDPATGNAQPFPPIDLLLRSAADMDKIRARLRAAGASETDFPITEPVVEGVVSTLGLDDPETIMLMSEVSLNELRIRYDLARTGAFARLRQAASDLTIEGGSGRLRVIYPSNLDLSASFILVSQEWLGGYELDGDPVFAVGTRLSMHVCGSRDADALDGMADIAEVMHRESIEDPEANGRPLTPRLLTVREGAIVPFLPKG